MKIQDLGHMLVSAMKDGDTEKRTYIKNIKALVESIAKNDGNREPVDSDIDNAAKRQYKLLKESKASGMDVDDEIEFVSQFIPKTLDTETMDKIVQDALTKNQTMGAIGIAKTLAKNYDGDLDMSYVSSKIKQYLGK